MELDEMKIHWLEISEKIDNQKNLTNKLIMDMTQNRYTGKFSTITMYETIGAVICLIASVIIIINFGKLNTWYLIASGAFTATYLLVLPMLVLSSLNRIRRLNIYNSSYKETVVGFAKAKKQLLLIQKSGIYLNFILMFVSIPLTAKIMSDKDVFVTNTQWVWFLPIMVIFLFLFSRWGYQCYKSITNSAENVLRELDE